MNPALSGYQNYSTKVNSLNLEFFNQAKNIPVVLHISSRGLWIVIIIGHSYINQINRDYYFIICLLEIVQILFILSKNLLEWLRICSY